MVGTPCNALNINQTGLVNFDGTATFTGVTVTNHNVLIGGSSNSITSVAPSATSGVPLISNGSSADPGFGTAVVAGGGTGAASFNTNGAVISNTSSTGALSAVSLADGQLLIGSSVGAPAAATLTAGAGVSITNGHNTITVAAVGGGFSWSDQSTSFNAAVANGYFCTAALTATLPASPNEGDTIAFIVDTASALTITANTGQKIRIGNTISASAGTAVSTKQGDTVTLTYRTTGATWFGRGSEGTFTVT